MYIAGEMSHSEEPSLLIIGRKGEDRIQVKRRPYVETYQGLYNLLN